MSKAGDEGDPETIVSMYMPHRKRRRIGAALLQLDRLNFLLLILLLVAAILFITAFMQEKMGNFTINLNRLELYRKGISISETGNFEDATARLTASNVQDATNISIDDLPGDLDGQEGSHNGKNYMAYTYYLRNAGKEDLGYIATITLDSCAKGAEKAVRIAVWRNGERVVYAAPATDGGDEEGCTSFESDNLVCTYTEKDFLVRKCRPLHNCYLDGRGRPGMCRFNYRRQCGIQHAHRCRLRRSDKSSLEIRQGYQGYSDRRQANRCGRQRSSEWQLLS